MIKWIRTSRLSIKNSLAREGGATWKEVTLERQLRGDDLPWEGRCKATWKREFKLPWREAGPPNHHDDKVDSDQEVVNKELSLSVSYGQTKPTS